MFPVNSETLALTSARLIAKYPRAQPALQYGEYFKWLGIRLTMTLDPLSGSVAEYWNTEPKAKSVIQPRNICGRFNMSKTRCEFIEKHLQRVPEVPVNVV